MTLVVGCSAARRPVPLGVVPEQQSVSNADIEYGTAVFDSLRARYPVSGDPDLNARVRKVVDQVTAKGEASKFPWFIYVLEGDHVKNAAATRGNYIFVWTGMVHATKSDGELAAVVAHEIAHVLAGHTAATADEELADIFGSILSEATERVMIHQGGAVGAAASLAASLVRLGFDAILVNPESQRKELEADQIGLLILAKSGIDPNEALRFWDRAQNDPAFGDSSIEFLSSHPGSTERLNAIKEQMPLALAIYRGEPTPPALISATSSPRVLPKRSPKPSIGDQPTGSPSSAERWVVIEDNVPVYGDPDPESELMGRLKVGTAVTVHSLEHRWLKISAPIAGYVRSPDLAPEN